MLLNLLQSATLIAQSPGDLQPGLLCLVAAENTARSERILFIKCDDQRKLEHRLDVSAGRA